MKKNMYSFKNDYSEGAHPRILQALSGSNMTQEEGYGEDRYSRRAADLLRDRIGHRDVDIHFLVGGTQVNLTAIAAFLRPYEAAVAAVTGHINVHETGAIEATGHKVIIADSDGDGKLLPAGIRRVLAAHEDEHMVHPRLVYISDTTEIGGVYTKKELRALKDCCAENGLYLYLDGARIGSALTAEASDLQLSDLAALTDAFYIGGTKNGALLGEALVIVNEALKPHFRYMMKQHGAMLAKGRVIGLQFRELFRDDLYFKLARHANDMAMQLYNGIRAAGFDFLTGSVSNQIFPILPERLVATLERNYAFYRWERMGGGGVAIRLVTSWATKAEAVDGFLAVVRRYRENSH
jgi:threonine aldolase